MHLTNAGVHPASCPTGMTSMRFLALVAAAMLAATLALTHQAGAILVLTLAVVHAERLMPRHRSIANAETLTAAGANT